MNAHTHIDDELFNLTVSTESQLANIQHFTKMAAAQSNVKGLVDSRELPALEMMAHDLGFTISNEGRLVDIVKSVATKTLDVFKSFGREIAAWADSSGRKKLVLLEEKVSRAVDEGHTSGIKAFNDRTLADRLQYNKRVYENGDGAFTMISELCKEVTDEFVIHLIDLYGRFYSTLERCEFYQGKNAGNIEYLDDMLDTLYAFLAREEDVYQWIDRHGAEEQVGGAALYTKSTMNVKYAEGLSDQAELIILERVKKRNLKLSSLADIRNPATHASVSTVKVLSLDEMQSIIQSMKHLTDEVERTSLILSDSKKQVLSVNVSAFLDSIETVEVFEVVDPGAGSSKSTKTIETSNITGRQRIRIDLLQDYIGVRAVHPPEILKTLISLQMHLFETYRKYIDKSLSMYSK